MIIDENQIDELNTYLNKSVIMQSSSIEGKKKFLNELEEWLGALYLENKKSVPSWVMTLTTEPVKVGKDALHIHTSFIDFQLTLCIQLLTDIRANYYLQKQLDESKKQTHEVKKQTRLSKRAFCISICAVVVSIVAVAVSTWATYISTRPQTIILDSVQYEKMYNILSSDSSSKW